MSDPLIRELENYVILEPGKKEEILSKEETLKWLEECIKKIEGELPKDLISKPSTKVAAKYLLDTACELEISPGLKVQWFAIRLNPPDS